MPAAMRWGRTMLWILGLAFVLPGLAWAGAAPEPIEVAGVPLEFILFALTLLGVALFHHKTLQVAVTGLSVITLYKIAFTGFKEGSGFAGFVAHLGHEWVVIFNLLGLLLGFALLARHFGDKHAGYQRLLGCAARQRGWGDCYGYALVATGRADVMLDPLMNPWDAAAVKPIVEEAGGTFTSVTGIPGPWEGNAIATNGLLHDRVLELLAAR